jgi:hypothetical protein
MHVVSAHHAADGHGPCFGLVALLTGMVVLPGPATSTMEALLPVGS